MSNRAVEDKALVATDQVVGKQIELGTVEHVAAMAAGALLMGIGMTRGGLPGALAKMGGAALILRGVSGYEPVYSALGLNMAKPGTGASRRAIRVESSVDIHRSPQDLYKLWRDFENIPAFMSNLVDVQVMDNTRSHWTARAIAGTTIQWDAEIIKDVKNEMIAWQTVEGSSIDHAGSVHFEAIEDGGTRMRVVLRYDPPADKLGAVIAKLFRGDPQTEIDQDLKRFAKIMNGLARAEAKAKLI